MGPTTATPGTATATPPKTMAMASPLEAMAITRGRLNPLTVPPSPTTPLEVTDTASTVLATPTPTDPPRVSTRGRLSPAMPLPLPTTLLAAMATTSTVPATPTPTGPPRVLTAFTRDRLVPSP